MIILTQDFYMVLFCVDKVRNYGIKVVFLRSGIMFSVRFCKLNRNYSSRFKFR